MKSIRYLALAFLLLLFASDVLGSASLQKVEYLSGSIAEKDGAYIRLLDGSLWTLSFTNLALVADDIIIIFQDIEMKDKTRRKLAVAYVDGCEIVAKHVGGQYTSRTGYLTTVIESRERGAVLKLADGPLLGIPKYDQYDTGWWLPPYKALLTGDGMYLWNLKRVKRVWVNPR